MIARLAPVVAILCDRPETANEPHKWKPIAEGGTSLGPTELTQSPISRSRSCWAIYARSAARASRNGCDQQFSLPQKVENPSICWGFQWRRRELKSGQEVAASGISRQIEALGAQQPDQEFRELPADAAICSARQQEPDALAEWFLRAVAAGDDGAVALATALADSVLDAGGVKLAQSVLEGGPLTLTRAIRLAELILTGRRQVERAGAL
jgi:hypothetical protein